METQRMTDTEKTFWNSPEPLVIIHKGSGKVSVIGKGIEACELCDKKSNCKGAALENCWLLCG